MGMTGFNPDVAVSNIKAFANAVGDAYVALQGVVGDMSFALAESWASANAVKFKSDVKPLFDELFQNMNDSSLAIQRGAIAAYNSDAYANGESQIPDFSEGFFDATDFAEMKESIDGKKGMEIEHVRNDVLPAFVSGMQSCADQIGNIPTSIALYDTEGGQQRAYSAGISNFKNKVISIMETTKAKIEEALNNEADVVFRGAKSAASEMDTAI